MKIIKSTVKTNLSGFCPGYSPEKCLFFDIETTGLSPRASSLYLIGALYYVSADEHWEMTQWFADKHRDEEEIIRNFLALLEQYDYLYHFNGKTFDIPYLLHKCNKYQIEPGAHATTILRDDTGLYSIDILAQIRPLKKLLTIPKASQTELERWLGIRRKDCYNGGELIPIYSQYMQDQLLHPEHAPELEALLLLHNHDDMEGMLAVCQIMNYRHLLESGTEEQNSIQIKTLTCLDDANRLRISFQHPAKLPKKVCIQKSYPVSPDTEILSLSAICTLVLEYDHGYLEVPIVQTELKYFLPDPENYYYLPAEDQAVHKSVAAFVEASHRKKATASNCYLRRSGKFIPSLQPYSKQKKHSKAVDADATKTPLFLQKYRDKLCFYQLPEEQDSSQPFWKEYLLRELAATLLPSPKNMHPKS